MIHVLHVSDKLTVGSSRIHGVTRLFSWWIPMFDPHRFRVSACSLRSRDQAGEYLEARGIKVFYLNRHKYDPRTFFDLVNLIREEKLHILHLHGYGAWTFGRLAGLWMGIPSVLHEHFHDPKIPLVQTWVDRLLGFIDGPVFANSQAVADFCTRDRGIAPSRIQVRYNGINLDEFKHAANVQPDGLRKALKIPDGNPVVGTISRLESQKGVAHFIRAVPGLVEKVPRVTFLIVGDGPDRNQLEEEARRLGVERHIVFAGFREDIPAILHLVDVFVIPSLWEGGTTLTVFEAMAMGKSIVSTNTGGVTEVLQDGKTAIFINPRDPESIATGILEVLEHPQRAMEMGAAAREASKDFEVRRTVLHLEQTYESLMGFPARIHDLSRDERVSKCG